MKEVFMSDRPDYDDPLPQHEVVTEFPEKIDDEPIEDDDELIPDPTREWLNLKPPVGGFLLSYM